MYAYERKRTLARLKQAEKNGLPAHDSACINNWLARAAHLRESTKDKTIRQASVRQYLYKRAVEYLIFAQDLLRYFENSIAKPDTGLEDWLKELGIGE